MNQVFDARPWYRKTATARNYQTGYVPYRGVIQSVYKDGRYTYINLQDGRTIKGKWNHAPSNALKGVKITWTTHNPARWNPDLWYSTVTLVA